MTGEREQKYNGHGSLDIKKYQDQISQNRAKIDGALVPNTFGGKLRSYLVGQIPFTSLRIALQQAPMEGVIHGLREPIIDLYNNMGDIIKEGTELVTFHNDIQKLLDEVTVNPEDETKIRMLRDKLREKAERDLAIKHDVSTEELLAQVLEPDDPEQRRQIREKTIFEANQVLKVSQTLAKIGQNIATSTAQTYETMNTQYALLLNIRKTVNVLHKSGADVIEAQRLRIEAFNSLVGQIDLLLNTATIATEVAQLTKEVQITIEANELTVLSERAESLQEKTFRILPPIKSRQEKQLTPPDPSLKS